MPYTVHIAAHAYMPDNAKHDRRSCVGIDARVAMAPNTNVLALNSMAYLALCTISAALYLATSRVWRVIVIELMVVHLWRPVIQMCFSRTKVLTNDNAPS